MSVSQPLNHLEYPVSSQRFSVAEKPIDEASLLERGLGSALSLVQLECGTVFQVLRDVLSPRRYIHSLGVCGVSIDLARYCGLSEEAQAQAATAGLLHDSAKHWSLERFRQYAVEHQITLSPEDWSTPNILHALLGAHWVRETFGIVDVAVLQAIEGHTTGRVGMSLVDKVVYVADKIEPNIRDAQWIETVLNHWNGLNPFQQLDHTLLFLLSDTLAHLKVKGQNVHPDTQDAYQAVMKTCQETHQKTHKKSLQDVTHSGF